MNSPASNQSRTAGAAGWMPDGEADWTVEGRPAGPCVRQARQGVGGRRRPGEAAPRALLGGDTRRGPRGAAHSTRARQGPALAGQARAPQGRGRRGFGGGASGCRRCSSVRAGSRWGGGTEATGGERASRAQQGGGQRRRSDARDREADSGKPRGGRPRAQGA